MSAQTINNTNNEFFTTYRVKFTVDNPVPVDIVIESLKAHERLLKKTGKFLESVYEGLNINETSVYVEEIIDGSWIVDFLIKYTIGKDNAEEAKKIIDNILDKKEAMRLAVALGVGALLYAGAQSIYTKKFPSAKPQPAIEAHNSLVLQAAGDINIPESKVNDFIESNLNNKQVAKDTISALKPAKVTQGSYMEVQGITADLTISNEVIDILPEDMSFIEPNEQDKIYHNIDVYVSASDEDSGKKGWGGLVPDLFNQRVKFVLDDGVDPKKLHGQRHIKADITVHEVYDASLNKFRVKSVIINKVY